MKCNKQLSSLLQEDTAKGKTQISGVQKYCTGKTRKLFKMKIKASRWTLWTDESLMCEVWLRWRWSASQQLAEQPMTRRRHGGSGRRWEVLSPGGRWPKLWEDEQATVTHRRRPHVVQRLRLWCGLSVTWSSSRTFCENAGSDNYCGVRSLRTGSVFTKYL